MQRPWSTRAIRHCGASNSLVVSILILIARLSSVWACLVWLGFSCRANLLSELALPEFCLLDLRGGKFKNLRVISRWMLFFFVLYDEKLLDEQLF